VVSCIQLFNDTTEHWIVGLWRGERDGTESHLLAALWSLNPWSLNPLSPRAPSTFPRAPSTAVAVAIPITSGASPSTPRTRHASSVSNKSLARLLARTRSFLTLDAGRVPALGAELLGDVIEALGVDGKVRVADTAAATHRSITV